MEDWTSRDRNGFIRKVFLILGAQLAFTAAGIAISQHYINQVGFTAQNTTTINALGRWGDDMVECGGVYQGELRIWRRRAGVYGQG